MTDDRIRAFLSDTLDLWRVAGTVEAGVAPVLAIIRADDGTIVWIERYVVHPSTSPRYAQDERSRTAPFRWLARWRAAGEAPGSGREQRPRACASLVGLLNAVRGALGVERGNAVRVVRPSTSAESAYAQDERKPAEPHLAVCPERNDVKSKGEHHMIPVSVITGFLGSGKTTLLGRLLRDPGMSRTAVVINELGAIGLDHDLIETSDESFVRLSNGCLCCNVRSDLVLTLGDLAVRRAQGSVPPFERMVIETTGLADPAPILHALMTDRDLCEIYALDGVITTVDALTGLATLDRHDESVRQAAVADRIVLTKTDVPGAQSGEIIRRLAELNPAAPVLSAVHGAIAPSALFDSGLYTAAGKHPDVHAWLAAEAVAATGGHVHSRHREDITSFCVVRDAPLHAVTLALFLSALAENCGADLLRMKGIVRVAEEPDRPAVIHGVQHVYYAPVWLERWPSADRRTRMVFIGRHIPEAWVRALLDLLDAEVADEIARRA